MARRAKRAPKRLVRKGTGSSPKTTRPVAASRRDRPVTAQPTLGRKLDAVPDRVDIRDWFYQPTLQPLPNLVVNCEQVPHILDQGQEGACTGYALAAVINFLLAGRGVRRLTSPRMIYEMARRYDEWPGEGYEGSSARGAMKGWVAHGVCSLEGWPVDLFGADHFTPERANEALATPGGAYYRLSHRNVRDVHAALAEVGIVYLTLMVHAGWDNPGNTKRSIRYRFNGLERERLFPVIERKGRAEDGHAVAILGYTNEGFLIQNSWGVDWGSGGFALLPYEDYMLHATDAWVAQLGVPLKMDVWAQAGADTTEGVQRATRAIPLSDIRPFVVDIGNNGKLSTSGEYWTTTDDLSRLFKPYALPGVEQTSAVIPEATKNWQRKRILLYLHGGLNDEGAVARRIMSFRDVLLANEIYPLHVMWESGLGETIRDLVDDYLHPSGDRAGGVAQWLDRLREGAVEAKDRTLELTLSKAGTVLWKEMKENALLASKRTDGQGGIQLLAGEARTALQRAADKNRWELHIVGHSAGAIFGAGALSQLQRVGIALKSVQFLAPAITVADFKALVLPLVQRGVSPLPTLYVLSDVGERDDDVGPYGKSLLYLVSNAFEGRRGEPILGMERFITGEVADPVVRQLYTKKSGGLSPLVVAGAGHGAGMASRSDSHGGFDSDPDTLNSVLYRILGTKPRREFTVRDLQ